MLRLLTEAGSKFKSLSLADVWVKLGRDEEALRPCLMWGVS